MALRRYISSTLAPLLGLEESAAAHEGRAAAGASAGASAEHAPPLALALALTPKERRALAIQLFVLALVLLLGAMQYAAARMRTSKGARGPDPASSDMKAGSKANANANAKASAPPLPLEPALARVHALYVYPVKSCAPLSLLSPPSPAAGISDATAGSSDATVGSSGAAAGSSGGAPARLPLTHKGFELDRRWCFVRRRARAGAGAAPSAGTTANGSARAGAGAGAGEWEKLTLKQEPRLVLIEPSLEGGAHGREEDGEQVLALRLSPRATAASAELGAAGAARTPARPSPAAVRSWQRIDGIDMYGDGVQGRVAPATADGQDPSAWASAFLGYEVRLVYFDRTEPARQRPAWPWYLPRSSGGGGGAEASRASKDRSHATEHEREHERSATARARGALADEHGHGKGIEFQDEYPLLIATLESMEAVQAQLEDAVAAALAGDGTDGRGGRAFAGVASAQAAQSFVEPAATAPRGKAATMTATPSELAHEQRPGDALSILRFRPNIVLAGLPSAPKLAPFDEENWEAVVLHAGEAPGGAQATSAESGASAHIALVTHCERCTITTVDPMTGEPDRAGMPLKLIARSHARDKKLSGRNGACFGIYSVPLPLSPIATGTSADGHADADYGSVAVGDIVSVRRRPPIAGS